MIVSGLLSHGEFIWGPHLASQYTEYLAGDFMGLEEEERDGLWGWRAIMEGSVDCVDFKRSLYCCVA